MNCDFVLIIDCGSTNITVSAIDTAGTIAATASRSNAPVYQPGTDTTIIWDMDTIWERITQATREVTSVIDSQCIRAAAVTTFGADGAILDSEGNLAYPVISWQCGRTDETIDEIAGLISPRQIYDITGYTIIRFNTILRLMWLKKHAPEVFDRHGHWLMMSGLISYRLTGERTIDATSAGTTMALDLANRAWSDEMLSLAGVDESFFPRWVEPGDIIGIITGQAAAETGIPQGTPVVAAGHDTQFALFGSDASENEAVVSSGTWEILLGRIRTFVPTDKGFENGLIYEPDCLPGWWNPQLLMMGSGSLEWVRKVFYSDKDRNNNAYDCMIGEADNVSPGSSGIFFLPTFVPGTGPLKQYGTPGVITGISISTTRGELYRAALEGLSFQLRRALEVMTDVTGFTPEGIRIVGGGAKNLLWNRIRADVTGLPVTLTGQSEITSLGAALFAFTGCGIFGSLNEALSATRSQVQVIEPSPDRDVYDLLYERFMTIPQSLASVYR